MPTFIYAVVYAITDIAMLSFQIFALECVSLYRLLQFSQCREAFLFRRFSESGISDERSTGSSDAALC